MSTSTSGALLFNAPFGMGIRLPRTLGTWSEGLMPGEDWPENRREPRDAPVCANAGLWTLTLEDLKTCCSPLHYEAWLEHIPSGLLTRLRHQNLDRLHVLFLLRHHPDLEELLKWPSCFRQHAAEWLRLLQQQDLQAADTHIRDLLSRPRRELFWAHPDVTHSPSDAKRYGRLMLAFAACFPGRFADRTGLLDHDRLRLIAPLLPAFFNSRRPFRQRLRTLQGFELAIRSVGLSASELAPFFHRCLKRGEKVRPNNLALTLERLQYLFLLRGKGSLPRLLQSAPGTGWLEKRLRQMERKTWARLSNGEQPHAAGDTRDFPDTTLPDVPWVEPLQTAGRLIFEGIYMQNCIATFMAELTSSEKAAYAIAWPERCTLLLERSGAGWRLLEVRAMDNQLVKAATLAAVQAWLDGNAPDGPPQAPNFFERLQHGLHPGAPYWVYLIDAHWPQQDEADVDEATSLPAPLTREPSLQIHLPEHIGRWRRLDVTEDLTDYAAECAQTSRQGSDLGLEDMMFYVHPDCPHLVACIPYCSDPGAALAFVRVSGTAPASMSQHPPALRDLQHQQALREGLATLLGDYERVPDDWPCR